MKETVPAQGSTTTLHVLGVQPAFPNLQRRGTPPTPAPPQLRLADACPARAQPQRQRMGIRERSRPRTPAGLLSDPRVPPVLLPGTPWDDSRFLALTQSLSGPLCGSCQYGEELAAWTSWASPSLLQDRVPESSRHHLFTTPASDSPRRDQPVPLKVWPEESRIPH